MSLKDEVRYVYKEYLEMYEKPSMGKSRTELPIGVIPLSKLQERIEHFRADIDFCKKMFKKMKNTDENKELIIELEENFNEFFGGLE